MVLKNLRTNSDIFLFSKSIGTSQITFYKTAGSGWLIVDNLVQASSKTQTWGSLISKLKKLVLDFIFKNQITAKRYCLHYHVQFNNLLGCLFFPKAGTKHCSNGDWDWAQSTTQTCLTSSWNCGCCCFSMHCPMLHTSLDRQSVLKVGWLSMSSL